MSKIEKCRLCGDCCVGCVFLYYDEKKDLMGCLIYRNNHRQLVTGWHLYSHYVKGNQRNLELFLEKLLAIILGENYPNTRRSGMCDNYQCAKIGKQQKVPQSIRESEVFRELQLTEAKIQQSHRNLMRDFEGLVEVLNS
ncbi:MAG: hypothetical protein JSV64_00715 [Candidatus Bathyarchaeota archaeon]|nr:MAG: hypothetical protein JSV64_00715 [Candidatus Bathyarchaeota archaeon]